MHGSPGRCDPQLQHLSFSALKVPHQALTVLRTARRQGSAALNGGSRGRIPKVELAEINVSPPRPRLCCSM